MLNIRLVAEGLESGTVEDIAVRGALKLAQVDKEASRASEAFYKQMKRQGLTIKQILAIESDYNAARFALAEAVARVTLRDSV